MSPDRHLGLEPGKRRTEAVVRAGAERHVLCGAASTHVDLVGVVSSTLAESGLKSELLELEIEKIRDELEEKRKLAKKIKNRLKRF